MQILFDVAKDLAMYGTFRLPLWISGMMSSDGLPLYLRMKKLEKLSLRNCLPGTQFSYWVEESLPRRAALEGVQRGNWRMPTYDQIVRNPRQQSGSVLPQR